MAASKRQKNNRFVKKRPQTDQNGTSPAHHCPVDFYPNLNKRPLVWVSGMSPKLRLVLFIVLKNLC